MSKYRRVWTPSMVGGMSKYVPECPRGEELAHVCGSVQKGPREACSHHLLVSQIPKEPVPRSLSQGLSSLQ